MAHLSMCSSFTNRRGSYTGPISILVCHSTNSYLHSAFVVNLQYSAARARAFLQLQQSEFEVLLQSSATLAKIVPIAMSTPLKPKTVQQHSQHSVAKASQSDSLSVLGDSPTGTPEGLSEEKLAELLGGKPDGTRYSAHLAQLEAVQKNLKFSPQTSRGTSESSKAQVKGFGDVGSWASKLLNEPTGASSEVPTLSGRPDLHVDTAMNAYTCGKYSAGEPDRNTTTPRGIALVDESRLPPALRTPTRSPHAELTVKSPSVRFIFSDSDEEIDENPTPAFISSKPPPSGTAPGAQSNTTPPFGPASATQNSTPSPFLTPLRTEFAPSNSPILLKSTGNSFRDDQIRNSALLATPIFVEKSEAELQATRFRAQIERRSQPETTPTRSSKRRPAPIVTSPDGWITTDALPEGSETMSATASPSSSGSPVKLAQLLGDEVLCPTSPGGLVSPLKAPGKIAEEHEKLVSGLPTTREERKERRLSGKVVAEGVKKVAKRLFDPVK